MIVSSSPHKDQTREPYNATDFTIGFFQNAKFIKRVTDTGDLIDKLAEEQAKIKSKSKRRLSSNA